MMDVYSGDIIVSGFVFLGLDNVAILTLDLVVNRFSGEFSFNHS